MPDPKDAQHPHCRCTVEPLDFAAWTRTAPPCNCGSVDKYGDDLGEHSPTCPYHLAAIARFGELYPTSG